MGGAGVTVTATTVERRRVLGEINTARRKEEKDRRKGKSTRKKKKDKRWGCERVTGREIDTDLSMQHETGGNCDCAG